MSTQFNLAAGQQLKLEGLTLAAEARRDILAACRAQLRTLAQMRPDRTVTADDAMLWLIENGFQPADLGPAAGSLFRTPEWESSGFVNSTRVSRHAGMIRTWRLK